MEKVQLEKLKYPIGKFESPKQISKENINDWIETIALFPETLKQSLATIRPEQLQWRYRPEGWMIKQVVHHCADSHMNSFIRFKWALTENEPTIKAYDEVAWAKLEDSLSDDLEESIKLLEGLHARWARLLHSLSDEDLNKTFIHPANKASINLKTNVGLYAWHGAHHLAHIRQALQADFKY